jgi:hypothetical protein
MIRVLHHMADAPAALRQVSRILSPKGIFILEFANKHNIKAIGRYLLRRQKWSPFSREPVEFTHLNFDFHPKAMRDWLKAVTLQPERMLTVSHFRVNMLKRILSPGFLAGLDSIFQWTGSLFQFSPSVFVRARQVKENPLAAKPADALSYFQCPECGQSPLNFSQDEIHCPACQRTWQITGGIYDFRGE